MTAWNKGLRKETDPRVAAYTRKSGESRKGKLYAHMIHTGPNDKISERLKQYFADPANRAKSEGANGSNWRGDNVSYSAMHKRLRKMKINACFLCGPCTMRTSMALIKGTGTHMSSDGRAYSVKLTDYVELCHSCHNNYDRGKVK